MRDKLITEVKKVLAAWYADNQDVYTDFREMVDKAISEGDMKLHEEIIEMLRSFIPDDIEQEAELTIEELDPEMERECNSFIEELESSEEECHEEEDEASSFEEVDYAETMEMLDSAMDKVVKKTSSEYDKMVVRMKPEIEAVEDVITKKIRTKDKMVFCYYYWMVFDNGPTDMATIYANHLRNNNVGIFWRWIFRFAFKVFVVYSFKTGARRMDWKNFIRKLDDEKARVDIKKGLQLAILEQSQGKRVDCSSLDQLIANPNVIDLIGLVLEKRKSDVDIAYLLMNLRHNNLISDVAYTTFHRALQNAFPDAGIKGYGKAQAKYRELRRICQKNPKDPCSLSHEKQVVAKLKILALDVYFKPYKNKEKENEENEFDL